LDDFSLTSTSKILFPIIEPGGFNYDFPSMKSNSFFFNWVFLQILSPKRNKEKKKKTEGEGFSFGRDLAIFFYFYFFFFSASPLCLSLPLCFSASLLLCFSASLYFSDSLPLFAFWGFFLFSRFSV